jgi:hypothetical protein
MLVNGAPGNWELVFGISDVTVAGFHKRAERGEYAPLRFLPQDFHTCGKHCGKAVAPPRGAAENVILGGVSWGESQQLPVFWVFFARRDAIRA